MKKSIWLLFFLLSGAGIYAQTTEAGPGSITPLDRNLLQNTTEYFLSLQESVLVLLCKKQIIVRQPDFVLHFEHIIRRD